MLSQGLFFVYLLYLIFFHSGSLLWHRQLERLNKIRLLMSL